MHPIAMMQATEMTRRAVRGAGPGDAPDGRTRRHAGRSRGAAAARSTRPATAAPAGAGPAAPVRTVNVVD
ncbi:MAG TPA: hypothetical protein VHF51_13335 [Solirubrobacteraceae bacterium]|nr:hypothetical protein [Solirubrobacteraceae bacterium]